MSRLPDAAVADALPPVEIAASVLSQLRRPALPVGKDADGRHQERAESIAGRLPVPERCGIPQPSSGASATLYALTSTPERAGHLQPRQTRRPGLGRHHPDRSGSVLGRWALSVCWRHRNSGTSHAQNIVVYRVPEEPDDARDRVSTIADDKLSLPVRRITARTIPTSHTMARDLLLVDRKRESLHLSPRAVAETLRSFRTAAPPSTGAAMKR